MLCAWIVNTSDPFPSFLEWIMILSCIFLRQFLCLPSRSKAMSSRLSQLKQLNDGSKRDPADDDRSTRQNLRASNTFIRYVQIWMLYHVTSAPFKIQARIWPVISWEVVKIATTASIIAYMFSYVTLKLSNQGTLTDFDLEASRQLHLNCNYFLAKLFLDIWQPRRLLLSKDNMMSDSR
jgi:hypothetical protein